MGIDISIYDKCFILNFLTYRQTISIELLQFFIDLFILRKHI